MTARRLSPPFRRNATASPARVASRLLRATVLLFLTVLAATGLMGARSSHAEADASPRTIAPARPAAPADGLSLRPSPRLAAAHPDAAVDDAEAGRVYVDRVLDDSPDPGRAGVAVPEAPAARGLLGPGRTVTGIEWTTLRAREDGRRRSEQGLAFSWRRETLDYGYLSADIAGRLEDDGSVVDERHAAGRFSLRQDDFVLGGGLLSDAALGDQVATTDPLLTRSFRFNLPSSYLRGGGLRLHDDRQALRLQAGRVGELRGDRVLGYESTGATLAGIGYSRALSPAWQAGLQFWSLRDDPDSGDHHALAAGVEHAYGPGRRIGLRGLRDSGGDLGLWLDGDHDTGTWRHRFGLFRFDPDLQWLDDGIADDRQGLYWRGDLRATRYDFSTGVDLAETNIEGRADRSGTVTASTFVRGTWLARRDLQLGASMDLRTTRDGRGLDVVEQNRTELRAFVSRRWALGTTRLQSDTTLTRGAERHDNAYELSLDHAWNLPGARLSTRLRTGRERGGSGDADLLSLGALAGVELARDLSLTGDFSASRTSTPADDTRTLRLALGLQWQLSRQWRLDVEQELVDRQVTGGASRDGRTDLELFARLRWSAASGREPAVLGRRGELPGTGRIAGVVFFDDNRDGLRSPGEEVVADARLVLDGRRAEVRTDAEGRYEFWPVFAGPHEVELRTEELPLPWGLPEDRPVAVNVAARETVTVDFPLVRLDE